MLNLNNLLFESSQFLVADYIIECIGPDAIQYLNSQCTNDISKLKENEFQFNSVVDIHGKLISSFLVLKVSKTHLIIILNKNISEITFERLEKYHISEDFEMKGKETYSYIKTHSEEKKYFGKFFFEDDELIISEKEVEGKNDYNFKILSVLTGAASFNPELDSKQLINNTIFDELSVDYKKGCYPGQETVSKINTRRGAAYKPVLLRISNALELNIGDKILLDDKKIGDILDFVIVANESYIKVRMLREHRIEGKSFEVSINGITDLATVYYLPYIPTAMNELAVFAYDQAISKFQNNDELLAEELFKKAISYDPLFEDAYESLGVLYGRQERFPEAISLMEKLKEINPKCMMAFTNLSLFHMKLGEIETAENYKSKATILNFQILGDEAERKRKEEEVAAKKLAEQSRREDMFKQVLDMDEEDPMANNGLAEILFERNEFEAAKEHFKKALSSDKKYSVAYLGLAKCYEKLGEKELLKEVLKQGIQIAGKAGELMPANQMQALLSKHL